MKPDYEGRVDKLLEEIEQLRSMLKCLLQFKAELKKKDELLFAYESVCAPVNPLLAENEQLKETVKSQGEECECRHNILCEIKEIVDAYFTENI